MRTERSRPKWRVDRGLAFWDSLTKVGLYLFIWKSKHNDSFSSFWLRERDVSLQQRKGWSKTWGCKSVIVPCYATCSCLRKGTLLSVNLVAAYAGVWGCRDWCDELQMAAQWNNESRLGSQPNLSSERNRGVKSTRDLACVLVLFHSPHFGRGNSLYLCSKLIGWVYLRSCFQQITLMGACPNQRGFAVCEVSLFAERCGHYWTFSITSFSLRERHISLQQNKEPFAGTRPN